MSPQGVITSPNYPANYDHNNNCAWKISAPQGQRIRVRLRKTSAVGYRASSDNRGMRY